MKTMGAEVVAADPNYEEAARYSRAWEVYAMLDSLPAFGDSIDAELADLQAQSSAGFGQFAMSQSTTPVVAWGAAGTAQAWHDSLALMPIGMLYAANAAAQLGDSLAAAAALSGLPAGLTVPEGAQRAVLTAWTTTGFGRYNNLDASTVTGLRILADACVNDYGPAVYGARMLIAHVNQEPDSVAYAPTCAPAGMQARIGGKATQAAKVLSAITFNGQELLLAEAGTLHIYDALGRQVYVGQLGEGHMPVSSFGLKAGMYYATLDHNKASPVRFALSN